MHDGTLSCGEALACSQTAKTEVDAERCFVDVCPGSSRALSNVTNCGFNLCNVECVFGGPDCAPCVAEKCEEAFFACFATGC